MRIKNDQEFYDWLHELEDQDSNWFDNIGSELKLNQYVDDGNVQIDVAQIAKERRHLAKIRNRIGVNQSSTWGSNSDNRNGVRIKVTIYRQYNLSYEEIAKILEIPASTIRHEYRELAPGEKIDVDLEALLHAQRPQAHQQKFYEHSK